MLQTNSESVIHIFPCVSFWCAEKSASGEMILLDPQQADRAASRSEKEDTETSEEDHTFIAFARIFSGEVRRGQRLYVLGPKHNPVSALSQVSSLGCAVS